MIISQDWHPISIGEIGVLLLIWFWSFPRQVYANNSPEAGGIGVIRSAVMDTVHVPAKARDLVSGQEEDPS